VNENCNGNDILGMGSLHSLWRNDNVTAFPKIPDLFVFVLRNTERLAVSAQLKLLVSRVRGLVLDRK